MLKWTDCLSIPSEAPENKRVLGVSFLLDEEDLFRKFTILGKKFALLEKKNFHFFSG